MIKVIFFNVLFIFALSALALANESNIGDGDHGKEKSKTLKANNKFNNPAYSFSLRSGMNFKGENLISGEPSKVDRSRLNFNNISLQKNDNNYLQPYKKKVLFNKLTFNPNELLRNYTK